jgi:hypothetical protein
LLITHGSTWSGKARSHLGSDLPGLFFGFFDSGVCCRPLARFCITSSFQKRGAAFQFVFTNCCCLFVFFSHNFFLTCWLGKLVGSTQGGGAPTHALPPGRRAATQPSQLGAPPARGQATKCPVPPGAPCLLFLCSSPIESLVLVSAPPEHLRLFVRCAVFTYTAPYKGHSAGSEGGGGGRRRLAPRSTYISDPIPSTGNPGSLLCQFATVRYTASLPSAARLLITLFYDHPCRLPCSRTGY